MVHLKPSFFNGHAKGIVVMITDKFMLNNLLFNIKLFKTFGCYGETIFFKTVDWQ